MKKIFNFGRLVLVLALWAKTGTGQAQAPNWRWAVQSINTANSDVVVNATTTDAAGNIYITGNMLGPVTFGTFTLVNPLGRSAFVAKLDATGQWLWAVQPVGNTIGSKIAVDGAGTVYVAGTYQDVATFGTVSLANRGQSDVFVARLAAATGQWMNAARAGGPEYDLCTGLAVVGTDVYVAGYYRTALAFDNLTTLSSYPNDGAGYVAKLTGANQWQWATSMPGCSIGGLVASAATGDLYVGANFFAGSTISLGPATLTNGLGSIVVARMSPATGAFVGATQGGGTTSASCDAVAVDSQGRLLVSGNFGQAFPTGNPISFGAFTLGAPAAGSAAISGDVYVACLDPTALTWQWATAVRCTNEIYVKGLAGGRNGEACVVGSFNGTLGAQGLTSTGQGSSFLVRLNATGQVLLADRANGTGRTIGYSVAVDNAGEVYLAGGFERTATFGATTLTSTVANNPNPNTVFIAKTGLLLGSKPALAAEPPALFPNPAHQSATLQVPGGFPAAGRSVSIYNALGEVVRRQAVPAAPATQSELNLAGLAPGIYTVVLRAGQQTASKRFAIE